MGVKASASITLSSVVDIEDAQRYYKLQESTLPKPEKPTINPPEGWSKTEPGYTNGSTSCLYFCDLTVFSDGSFSYSEVSLSSSYEAAKEAYKKASSAEDTAVQLVTRVTNAEASITKNSRAIELRATKTEVTEAVNNVQIGGVNRVLNTGTPKSAYGNGGSNQCTSLYNFANSFFIDIGENEFVTTSFDWETTATSGRFQIQGGGDPSYPTFDWDVVVNESNTSGHRIRTTRMAVDARSVAIRLDGIDGTVTISNFKIEKGNKATDWSPAPEDVANDATSKADQALASAKSYSDSQLSVQADRITGAVSRIDALGVRTSTLEQTAEGFTVSLGTVDAKAGEAASAAAAAKSTADTAKTDVSVVQQGVDSNVSDIRNLNGRLTDEIEARKSFMRFSEESSDPTLTLGQTDSPAQVKLTNKQLQFLYLNSIVAYMSGDALLINNARILQQLQLGGFAFVPRGNGNLAFKWVGGDS